MPGLFAATCYFLLLLTLSPKTHQPVRIADQHDEAERSPCAQSRQVVLVITDSWDAVAGELWYFEREKLGGTWR